MPELTVNGAALHYEEQGSGEETLVFSHGLLMNGHMFDAQVAALCERYRCIIYDHRGQGRSAGTRDGYDMDTLAEDAAALIEALGAGPCHFVGLSMGGFVGLRLALRRPQLLRSLTLMDTSADEEARENIPKYRLLNGIVRLLGVRPVLGSVMPIMFGDDFLQDPARADERRHWKNELGKNRRRYITRAVQGVITRDAVYSELDRIDLPTLIIVGDQDKATPPPKSERLHGAIAGSRLVVVPKAGHSASLEQPEAVTRAMREFYSSLGG